MWLSSFPLSREGPINVVLFIVRQCRSETDTTARVVSAVGVLHNNWHYY